MLPGRMRNQVVRGGTLAWGLMALASSPSPGQAEPPPLLSASAVPVPIGSPQAVIPSPQSDLGSGGPVTNCGGGNVPIASIKQLVRMSGPELDQLYRQSSAAAIPAGRVKGRAILYPGTRLAVPASNVARFLWQGKIINDDSTAVNKFFGVRAIRGNLYLGESWLDGQPSLILDYSETSRIYAANRDEIREVAPGLFLGLMYGRTTPNPTLKMYFALTTQE